MKQIIIVVLLLLNGISAYAMADEGKSVVLSPVPLTGSSLTVKVINPNVRIERVELRNLIGKKLQEKIFPSGSTQVIMEDMDSYPSGVYMVLSKDSYGKVVEINKFIINK